MPIFDEIIADLPSYLHVPATNYVVFVKLDFSFTSLDHKEWLMSQSAIEINCHSL